MLRTESYIECLEALVLVLISQRGSLTDIPITDPRAAAILKRNHVTQIDIVAEINAQREAREKMKNG